MIITLFGCGAVGSQVALHLAHPDIKFILIDDDRVEEDNLLTSAFVKSQIGINKGQALANLLWRKNECASDFHNLTLNIKNYPKFIEKSDLALDCFDNAEARNITCKHSIPTLHIGVSNQGTGGVTWDEDYNQLTGLPRGQDRFCTHLAGRGIIRLTASMAALVVEKYMENGKKISLVVTDGFYIYL